MPTSVKPFVLNNLTLTLKKITNADGTPATGGAATSYECQLGKAQITPSAGSTSTIDYVTFCGVKSEPDKTGATYTLDLGGFQAYADVADLSVLLWQDAGAVYQFVLIPTGGTISATNPGFEGEVTLVEGPIGGTAGQHATFEVSLPCVDKPAMIVVPPAVLEFA